jgi:hypothetical protein
VLVHIPTGRILRGLGIGAGDTRRGRLRKILRGTVIRLAETVEFVADLGKLASFGDWGELEKQKSVYKELYNEDAHVSFPVRRGNHVEKDSNKRVEFLKDPSCADFGIQGQFEPAKNQRIKVKDP